MVSQASPLTWEGEAHHCLPVFVLNKTAVDLHNSQYKVSPVLPGIELASVLRRFVHDAMDVESVESRFSDMSLSPIGGYGNYAHSDSQLSGSPYKGGNPSMSLSPYSTAGSRSADSWHAQRSYERPLGTYSRPGEILHVTERNTTVMKFRHPTALDCKCCSLLPPRRWPALR